jgi:Zn-dependent metalloprotease
MPMLNLDICMVRWDKENYIPRKIYGFETEPQSGTPREIAEKFIEENRTVLKITGADLRFEKTSESIGNTAVFFQQYFNNKPIHAAWVAVHINRQNRIFLVKNETVSAVRLAKKFSKKSESPLPPKDIDPIIANHVRSYGELDSRIDKESMIHVVKGRITEVWKVKFSTKNPRGTWILFVDKNTGGIIDDKNILWNAEGKGKVFLPNPVVTLDRDDLLDKMDRDQRVLEPAYKTVVLKDLKPEGYLSGPYVDTQLTPGRVKSKTLDFLYTRDNPGFEEVMAYYHIDALQRYIQSLGFAGIKGILNKPISINVHGGPDDQSYYDPASGKKSIVLGDGGVDDGEDADIILHEYGHALQDAIIPGFGQNQETRSMGEGISDYLAASFFEKYKSKSRKVKLGEWDAKGYKGGPDECLRRLDSTKKYPADMEGEEHADGEIWSACLWKVRKLLGAKKADTVILESLFYLNQYSDFRDGSDAILIAEKNLYGGKKKTGLLKIFRGTGIIL